MPFEKGTFITPKPQDPRYVESRNMGFRGSWQVANEYEIVKGVLRPKPSSSWREIYPANYRSIPLQLAKIDEGDELALLAFARKYGALGFARTLPFTVPWLMSRGRLRTSAELLASPVFLTDTPPKKRALLAREFVRLEQEQYRQAINDLTAACAMGDERTWEEWIASGGGDPLPWVWTHIRTLKICCALTEYIQDKDEELAASYLRKFQDRFHKPASELCPLFTVAFRHRITNELWSIPGGDGEKWTVLDFAKFLRRLFINENIDQIHPAIEPEGHIEKSFFQFRAMIEIAYWHLHNLSIEGVLKQCERTGCSGIFVQEHGRQRFCPDPKTPKGESRCAALDRAKRAMPKYRKKLKQKQKLKN